MYELVSLCHDENKFIRDVKPLCTFLDTCDELDEGNFHSLLMASLPGPLLDPPNAQKIQIAILNYIVRFSAHVRFPKYWEIISAQLDISLRQYYESIAAEGIRMKHFLKNKRDVLGLFVDPEVVLALVAADGEYHNHSQHVRTMMSSGFETGVAMFKDKWLGCANDLYEEDIKVQLMGLEHNDFDSQECDSFFKILSKKAAGLKLAGQGKKLRWRYAFDIYGTKLAPMDVDDPRDAAHHALKNRLKTIAMNSHQFKPLWWEPLMFPKGSIPDCPLHLKVPEKWIEKLMPAREFMGDIVEDCKTIHDVIRKIEKSAATLISLDRNFECDINFMRNHGVAVLQKRVEEMVLDTLPTDGASADFAITLAKIRDVRKSETVAALGDSYAQEVDGIYDLLQQISSGQPPQDKDVSRFSSLTKQVLQRSALFCRFEVPGAERKGRGKCSPLVVYGVEAVQQRFNMLQDAAKKGQTMDLQELRPVKQFKWLLEDAQKLTFAQWLRVAIPAHSSCMPALANDSAQSETQGGGASSSIAASSSAGNASDGSAPKKKAKATPQLPNDAKQALLAKLFKKTTKVT